MESSTQIDFQSLTNLRAEVSAYARPHLAALEQFYVKSDQAGKGIVPGFSHTLEKTARISIASTATCVRSLFWCPDFLELNNRSFGPLRAELVKRFLGDGLSTTGLQPLNAFTVGQVLSILKHIGFVKTDKIFADCLQAAKSAISEDGVRIGTFPANGYLTYWILVGLQASGEDVGTLAVRSLNWSENELYKQISFFVAGDDEHSDAFQLGYNLLIQYRFRRDELPRPIVEAALKTLFAAQLPRGVWEKKDPLFVYGESGDAYCFPFELLNSLFSEFCGDESSLMHFAENFAKAFLWVKRGRTDAPSGPVWRSGHRVNNSQPESWATAEVYQFLRCYESYLSRWLHSLALRKLRCAIPPSINNLHAFDGLYHPEIVFPDNKRFLLNRLMIDHVLNPLILPGGKRLFSLVQHPSRRSLVRSGILFGPPGTGKTSYVKSIAAFLGWPLVILDPSDFARAGFPMIPNTTSELFEHLVELEDTVIFFDEMEVLIHERKDKVSSGFEEKFLTTSLLPKLQNLHDAAKSLFFVATNLETDIDEAAKREGRFDFKLQVMPPSYEEKRRYFADVVGQKKLDDVGVELDHHKVKIEYATLREFRALVDKLSDADVERARALLEEFGPKLLKDKSKLESERANNTFEFKK